MSPIMKFIFALMVIFVAVNQLPQVHNATRHMFAKRAQKGFSSLERFNDKLWHGK